MKNQTASLMLVGSKPTSIDQTIEASPMFGGHPKHLLGLLFLLTFCFSLLVAWPGSAQAEPEVYWKWTGTEWGDKKFTLKGQIINNSNKTVVRIDERTLTINCQGIYRKDKSVVSWLDDLKINRTYEDSRKVNFPPDSVQSWNIGPFKYPDKVVDGEYGLRIKKANLSFKYRLASGSSSGGTGESKNNGVTINIGK